MREPQGVASLALGYVLHWAFSPPFLNPKLELSNRNFLDLFARLYDIGGSGEGKRATGGA